MELVMGVSTETSFSVQRRGRWSWLAVVALLLAVTLPTIGAWNPWNLVVLNRALVRPVLAGVVVAASLGFLCHIHVRRDWVRVLSFGTISGLAFLWALGWWALGSLEDQRVLSSIVASPFNDVELVVRSDDMGSTSFVGLRADRGLLWSRENDVGAVWTDLSGAPVLDARFVASDELVIAARGRTVLRVRFDARDLAVVDTECRTVGSPARGIVTSCLGNT